MISLVGIVIVCPSGMGNYGFHGIGFRSDD